MNIAVISFKDVDVTLGIQELIQTYGEDKPIFFLPLTKSYNLFTQSVIDTCRSNGVEVHCFFPNANGFEDLLTQADDIILTDNPVKEVLRQLNANDSLGIVWDEFHKIPIFPEQVFQERSCQKARLFEIL